MTGELKPCPFCGGEARFVEDHGRFDEPFGLIVDHAEDCFSGSRIMAEWDAITAAWNTRAPDATLQATVERQAAEIASLRDYIASADHNQRLAARMGGTIVPRQALGDHNG